MSKTKKQRAAEALFNDSLQFYDVSLEQRDFKLIKKICVEMYETGFEDALYELEEKFNDSVNRLTS